VAGTTGITGDASDEAISLESGNTLAKYIKIDVPDFNNALAGDLTDAAQIAQGAGSGQGSMRSYLRLGAIEQALNKTTGQWGPSSKVGKGATPSTPNAADLAALISVVGNNNPLLWSTVSGGTPGGGDSGFMSSLNAVESGPQTYAGAPTFTQPTASQIAQYGANTFSNPATGGGAQSTLQSTNGLVIPGQLSATMIQSGVTGSTGDPYLQELVASSYDSTGEDLASLVKGFIDDSRMRSDAGSTAWWGGAVRIDTPFNSNYSVEVHSNLYAQGIPSPSGSWSVDSELAGIAPAAFFMPTWTTAVSPPGHAGSTAWGTFPGTAGPTGVDWTLGGFPAPTDAGFAVGGYTGPAPFVPGWMIPIRLGGPSPSSWGAQATLNTSVVEGPLYGWDPHPSANMNSPDWQGAIITTPVGVQMPTTLPAFSIDADGNKLGAGVPLDPRDITGMTPLPGYGTLLSSQQALGDLAPTWDTGNINAVSTWLATDYRTIESNQLHTKGGWRDHTDGNRITTTRGDKVEVIRGNYKLIVVGRQDGTKGAGFDMGGGGNDTFTTASASTDPSTLSTITEYKLCDDGQYRSWSTTKKGSGTPKIGGDGVTVTLPTGSVQVSETWGWKSYSYTGVEKMKILSGGSGPPAGWSADGSGNNWFGPVQYSSGDPAKPQSYIPVAAGASGKGYTAYDATAAGFAGGPKSAIAGENIFIKTGMNDDTRGMIWPVAETISESHTTKTYSATFVRDTVSITAGPMLTVPFSLNSNGAGMILPWPTYPAAGFGPSPLQVPPTAGAYPAIVQQAGAPGVAGSYAYGPAAPALNLEAFGAFPLKGGSYTKDGAGNTAPTVDGGLPSDYDPAKHAKPPRLELEGTGIPIPGQPYQKVNSTTAESHVKTQISRNFVDVQFSQNFVGKSYSQSGTQGTPNQLTNSMSFVDTAVAESHTNHDTKYTFTGHSKSETYIGDGGWDTFDAVTGGILGPLGAVLDGAFVPCKDDYTKIVGNTQSRAETYGTTSDYKMLIGASSSMGLTIGTTSDIKVLVGASSSISVTAGATSTINIVAAATSTIKLSATVEFSMSAVAGATTELKFGSVTQHIKVAGVWTTAKAAAADNKAKLVASLNKLVAGLENEMAAGVCTNIAPMTTELAGLIIKP
jgi:hypothetical protein